MNDLIAGAVFGYSYDKIAPFVESLRATDYSGRIVFFTSHIDRESLDRLKDRGVECIQIHYRSTGALNSWSRFWPTLRRVLRFMPAPVRKRTYRKITNFALVRYLHFLDFLKREETFRYVLFTDIRDVVFQDTPFSTDLPGEFCAYLESPHMVYGKEPLNDGWIRRNYDESKLKQLHGTRISCCGTIAGTMPGMLNYLKAFENEFIQLASLEHGADTSIHNRLIRQPLKSTTTICDNFEGEIGTISERSEESVYDDQFIVRRPDKSIVPVIHQYDRLDKLRQHWDMQHIRHNDVRPNQQ